MNASMIHGMDSPAVVECSSTDSAPAPDEPSSVLDRAHIVASPLNPPRESSISFAIIGDAHLLRETCQRVISSMILDETDTSLVRERVTALYPKIIKRFNQFKQHNISPSADLQYHYALLAFETNISRCLELIGICGHVMKNVETATIEDSLLRPKGVAIYYSHDDDHCKDFQGVALYHDSQRARFISAVHVDGKEKSFLKQYEKDLSNSKDPTTELTRAYPNKKPSNPGGWRGQFRDLDMYAAFVVDPSDRGDNDCLTRVGGVFVWGVGRRRRLVTQTGSVQSRRS